MHKAFVEDIEDDIIDFEGSDSLLMNDRYARNDIVWAVYEYMASELLDLLDQDRYDIVYGE